MLIRWSLDNVAILDGCIFKVLITPFPLLASTPPRGAVESRAVSWEKEEEEEVKWVP